MKLKTEFQSLFGKLFISLVHNRQQYWCFPSDIWCNMLTPPFLCLHWIPVACRYLR